MRINQFDTEWLELSNFAYSSFEFNAVIYPTSEHAFQAQKVLNLINRQMVINARTPAEAKQLAHIYKDHPDWNSVKVQIMKEILLCKFSSNEYLKNKLLSTGNYYLEEGNTWGDVFWGTVNGIGENMLGKLLMDVRDELK